MKKKSLNLPTPQPKRPILRFTPTAWAKLLFLRDLGSTEIGGFGLATAGDLLRIEDIGLVEQVCTAVHVEFDDRSVADFFDQQVDAGRRPAEFARIWLHTHPGSSAAPSQTDEQTFEHVFGRTDWAVMFILARGGQSYARLRYNVGPGADVQLPVEVDYRRPFDASEEALWEREYDDHVGKLAGAHGDSCALGPCSATAADTNGRQLAPIATPAVLRDGGCAGPDARHREGGTCHQ